MRKVTTCSKDFRENLDEIASLMAFEVTKLVHGEEEASKVLKTSEELFTKKNIDNENMPEIEIFIEEKNMNVVDFIARSNIVSSKSEIRRLVEQKGIEINGNKISLNDSLDFSEKNKFVIKKGKKTFLKVIVKR